MADGYGFGGEGDWKTSALLRVAQGRRRRAARRHLVHGGLHLRPGPGRRADPRRPHARGLPDASPARSRGSRCTRWASAAARTRPGWCSPPRPAPGVVVGWSTCGDRFRWVANEIDVVEPSEPLPNLPVARAVWQPRPDFATCDRGLADRRRPAPHRADHAARRRRAHRPGRGVLDRAGAHRRRHHAALAGQGAALERRLPPPRPAPVAPLRTFRAESPADEPDFRRRKSG